MLAAALVAVPGPEGEVPRYEELRDLPGLVLPPVRSVGRDRSGMEWSSVASFGGELLLLDDRKGPVVPADGSTPALAPETEAARGLVLFRLAGADRSPPALRLERAFATAWLRDIVAPGHRFENLEATATRGPHLYLMASHAPRRNGRFRPDRQVALRVTGGERPEVAFRDIRLRDALPPLVDALPELAASLPARDVDPPARDGQLAVEGLAVLPGSSDFLLGLRAPKVDVAGAPDPRCRKAAVVLRLHDLDAVFDRGASPTLSVHALLCLGDRGIASLAWDPTSTSYLVAVSRPPSGKGDTTLWQWDPRPCADPPLRELARFTHLRLEGIDRVEGGPLDGKLALAFDSHYYAGARRPHNVNEGSLAVVDWEPAPLCGSGSP